MNSGWISMLHDKFRIPLNPLRGVFVIALPMLLFASEHDEVLIKTSLTQKNVVLVNAELDGKHVQLECFLSDSTCKAPKEGRYTITRLKPDESIYQDCQNIAVYELAKGGKEGKKVGEYCLLGE